MRKKKKKKKLNVIISFNNLTFHFVKEKEEQRILMSELCFSVAGHRGVLHVGGREHSWGGTSPYSLGLST